MGTTTSQLAGIQYRLPYTQRDYTSLMESIRQKIPQNVPEWNDLQDSNYGIFILSTVAAIADWLAFYGDRAAAESFILTCIGKSSITNLLQLLNYQLRNMVASYTTLRISLPDALPNDVLIPQYTEFSDVSGSNRFVTTIGSSISAGDLYADVPARQGSWQSDSYTSDGSAQQRLILSRTDIADGFIRVWVGQEEWSQATDNTFAGSENWQHLFRVIVNAISSPGPAEATPATDPELVVTTVEFGDNFEGAIPPQGMPIRVDFMVTAGDSIKVPTGSITQVASQIFDALGNLTTIRVTNLQSAAGGDAAESLYAARKNYPQRFRTMNRAVTTYDFRVYASSYPGVLIAKVFDVNNNADNDDNLTPDRPIPVERAIPFYQARIYAIPRNDWSSDALNHALQQWLQERCPVDKQVVVLSPLPVGIDIIINLRVYATFDPQAVKFGVMQAVQTYFSLTVDGDIQIGTTFYSTRLITILQQIPGVASLDFVAGLVGQPPTQDITPQFDQIIQLHSVTVTLPFSTL